MKRNAVRAGGATARGPWTLQLLTMVAAVLLFTPGSARAEAYVSISGAGSTWSQVALGAWATDVDKFGIEVNYESTGSTNGRQQYIFGTVDYAVSEIPFQPEETPTRPFAYLPVVAGGTSFMYHLTVAGQRVTDLRLSGDTVTKIFTGVITNWNDPQITADYGKALPNIAIKPVVRSDGSGTSAQFTLYMSKQHPDLWNAFCQQYMGLTPPCGLTSFYPQFPGSTSQSGSNGVANYVAASYGEGAITYVEYAYALGLGFPVAKVLNAGGYYTAPTAANVAVALTAATIKEDLTQELSGVYNNTDTRTYPLSSYSYMIVPTTTAAPMNADKGKSLSTFVNYFLCGGQQKAEVLGYSPLPINLVEAGFDVVRRIPGFVEPPGGDLAECNNPTFQGGVNVLLRDAPFPSECDKAGSAPNCTDAGTPPAETPGATTAPTGPASGGGAQTAGPAPGEAGDAATAAAEQTAAASAGVDPETGLAFAGDSTDTGVAVASVQDVGAFRNASAQTRVVYGLTAAELLLAVLIPPLMAVLLRRRRSTIPSNDSGNSS